MVGQTRTLLALALLLASLLVTAAGRFVGVLGARQQGCQAISSFGLPVVVAGRLAPLTLHSPYHPPPRRGALLTSKRLAARPPVIPPTLPACASAGRPLAQPLHPRRLLSKPADTPAAPGRGLG